MNRLPPCRVLGADPCHQPSLSALAIQKRTEFRAFVRGHAETFGAGVLGPALAPSAYSPYLSSHRVAWAVRTGNEIDVNLPLAAGVQAGHIWTGNTVTQTTEQAYPVR